MSSDGGLYPVRFCLSAKKTGQMNFFRYGVD